MKFEGRDDVLQVWVCNNEPRSPLVTPTLEKQEMMEMERKGECICPQPSVLLTCLPAEPGQPFSSYAPRSDCVFVLSKPNERHRQATHCHTTSTTP